MSYASLPCLLIALVILLGAVAGVVLLLVNPRTRLAGIIVLGVGGVLLLLGVLTSFIRLQTGEKPWISPQPKVVVETTKPAPPPKKPAPRQKNLWQAMLRAIADALDDDPAVGVERPLTPPRPAWVDQPPGRHGDAYRMAVAVGPFSTREECDAKLPEALETALAEYTEVLISPEAARRVRLPADELRQHVVKEQFEETIHASFGPMIQLHTLVEFDAAMQGRIKEKWRDELVRGRLKCAGVGLAAALTLLAAAFGFLKIHHAGPTPRRLLRLVGLAVLTAIAVAAEMMVLWGG